MSSPSLLVTLTAVLVGILAASTANGLHLSHNKVSEFLEKSALESQELARNNEDPGTRWAVLIAGSNGYWNYRHQADVCHAYQLLREGGLKDENIVVFMYDDIANSEENLDRGKLFNRPGGPDVYKGVPKDYTGEQVTANNFYAAILGNRSAITGGSGKVVDSGPNDHIFIYYSDHGGGGAIGMPVGAMVYAADLNKVLKQKHALGSYKQLVFYLEACESGSMFEGLLPKGLDIYAITAANAHESSWAYYCPGDPAVGKHKYSSCLGDLFSIAWMEDVEGHERKSETFEQDYEVVKNETANPPVSTYEGSHVLRFGDINLSRDHLDLFMGEYDGSRKRTVTGSDSGKFSSSLKPVRQHEADLVHFRHKVLAAPKGSEQELRAQRELDEILEHRDHIDNSMARIGSELFGVESMNKLKSARREAGRPVVDDWDCLKSLVREFETHCGSMAQYGLRHMRYLANLCNVGVNTDQMSKVSARVCTSVPKSRWSSLARGFSA